MSCNQFPLDSIHRWQFFNHKTDFRKRRLWEISEDRFRIDSSRYPLITYFWHRSMLCCCIQSIYIRFDPSTALFRPHNRFPETDVRGKIARRFGIHESSIMPCWHKDMSWRCIVIDSRVNWSSELICKAAGQGFLFFGWNGAPISLTDIDAELLHLADSGSCSVDVIRPIFALFDPPGDPFSTSDMIPETPHGKIGPAIAYSADRLRSIIPKISFCHSILLHSQFPSRQS